MKAQVANCTFKPPQVTINFGSGYDVQEFNTSMLLNYNRVRSSCPTDGHYTYTSYTSDCFSGDWFTLEEDHTKGDESGNMLLVNSAYRTGVFFKTVIRGLKANTTYEFGMWLMNLCRITEKCPYPLLPSITILLQTPSGSTLATFETGDVVRVKAPHWTQHRAMFKTPASETSVVITMINGMHGGCGNDFALDDITFRECVKTTAKTATATTKPRNVPAKTATTSNRPKTAKPESTSKPVTTSKPVAKKVTPVPDKKPPQSSPTAKTVKEPPKISPLPSKATTLKMPPPPKALTARENALVQQVEIESGNIAINLYDNAEIDGDTVSIYHNNVLLVSRARLSQKPITLSIPIDSTRPHHELVMVAENLGSIPPNTSLMVVTAGTRRYEIFISSSEQKNAKVVFNLKE